ncbi:MAG: bis(5'-nucleosyl)-tetraphosphatase (symmetrical) YqeK [Tissierellaceae bacterium]|nr:bis(5'-nucleosyl)-tetraphosphatase (symmetrical) YqeK [Tissierellaceae bacterium]
MYKSIEKDLIIDIGKKRYEHSLRVMEMAMKLAKIYDIDVENARLAALLHDCGKLQGQTNLLKVAKDFDIIIDNYMTYNGDLVHGPLGAYIAKTKYNIKNEEILNAIRYHTTGKKDMTTLEKIIYISDYIELGRDFPGLRKMRRLSFKDLDRGLLMAMGSTISFLVKENKLIHPRTIEARNYLIMELGI